jgi:2,3-bisphosphoglycerate-independent phosphoglycerate mutase
LKFLILIGDGMADFPLESCGGSTPLSVAQTPALDEVARLGICGLFCPIPDAYPAGSDIGNLSLFGYNPDESFAGRAPLEAANRGIALGPDQLAFRCNLVTLGNGCMKDFTADHISTKEAAELIGSLERALGGSNLTFHPGVSYRHLATITPTASAFDQFVSLACTPPHDITDQEYAPYLPQGCGNERILELIVQSQAILADHPVNKARIANGKLPATSIWPWGQGKAPDMELYESRFGITGAVVSAVDLVNGIGRNAGFEVIAVEGATGYLDTNYEGKVEAALDALDRVDFVFVHIEAPDEASHEGRTDLKIQAIEDYDKRVVAPCLARARERGDCRVLIAPDHITSIETRTHAQGPVPFAMCGPGIEQDARVEYNEASAAEAGVLFPAGYTLVAAIIQEANLRAEVWQST